MSESQPDPEIEQLSRAIMKKFGGHMPINLEWNIARHIIEDLGYRVKLTPSSDPLGGAGNYLDIPNPVPDAGRLELRERLGRAILRTRLKFLDLLLDPVNINALIDAVILEYGHPEAGKDTHD